MTVAPRFSPGRPLFSTLLLAMIACAPSGNNTGDGDGDNTVVSYPDADGDTILDIHEGFFDDGRSSAPDTDADGTADYVDDDSDGDGILDKDEAGDADPLTLPWDTDNDGVPNFQDLDSDGNCIADPDEGKFDIDGDGVLPFADPDDDGDNILDTYEIGPDCELIDTDADDVPDFKDEDSDGDVILDKYEAGTSAYQPEPADSDGDGVPDFRDDDSDGDGLDDRSEKGGKGPVEPLDTDGDGIYDFQDVDSDGDGLTDRDEAFKYNTDWLIPDTDGDGFSDGAEVRADSDPLDGSSGIEGIYVVVEERTSVEKAFDFELNVQMGDIVFLLDTTCSMSSTLNGMKSEYSAMVSEIAAVLPDAQYGVASFDDYAYGSYGSSFSNDKPFELRTQVTDNISQVQSALSKLSLHGGGDGPEGSMEALYQGLTGAGYDQNCNGTYNKDVDVKPFLASSSDPFGGGGGQSFDAASSGGGRAGGFGFRPYALPVLVIATDNYMRDPDSTNGTYNGAPKGCPIDGGSKDVIAAATSLNAYLIGISVSGSLPVPQMNDLADKTGSIADTDGDGLVDDRLVFQWSGSSSALRKTITEAIKDLVGSIKVSEVSLVVSGDDYGFVTDIEPASVPVSGDVSGEELSFTLNFRGAVAALEEDQLYKLRLDVVGDGTILLDTLDIYVVVPGGS